MFFKGSGLCHKAGLTHFIFLHHVSQLMSKISYFCLQYFTENSQFFFFYWQLTITLLNTHFLRQKQLYSSQSEVRQIQTPYGTAWFWCLWLIINNSKIIMQKRRGSSKCPHKLVILLACSTQTFFTFSDINTEWQPDFLTNNNCAQFEGKCTYTDS